MRRVLLVALMVLGVGLMAAPVLAATIIGTDDSEELIGTAEADVISGRGGNDIVEGRRDGDLLYGGLGNDRVRGNSGDDTIFGNAGNDVIKAGYGRDWVSGGHGDDILEVIDRQADTVDCGGGDDIVYYDAKLDHLGRDCEGFVIHPIRDGTTWRPLAGVDLR